MGVAWHALGPEWADPDNIRVPVLRPRYAARVGGGVVPNGAMRGGPDGIRALLVSWGCVGCVLPPSPQGIGGEHKLRIIIVTSLVVVSL